MTEMAKIITNINSAFPKAFCEKQNSPSYVRMYEKTDNEIALCCIKSKPVAYNSGPRNNGKIDNDDLELTGSPLKLDLSMHTLLDETLPSDEPQLWYKDEAYHLPIGLKQAREIANTYNQLLREHDTPEEPVPLWVLCCPTDANKTLLLMVQSDREHFIRGVVAYKGCLTLEDISVEKIIKDYAIQENISKDLVSCIVECKHSLYGVSYANSGHTTDELVNSPFGSSSQLYCQWSGPVKQTPVMDCTVLFEQEVIVGHLISPCASIWQSICALHNMNRLLVDMTVAGFASVDLSYALIRRDVVGSRRPNNSARLAQLLDDVETYSYMAQCPSGGCLCVTADTNSLNMCLDALHHDGSSNDFTYKLWDILKECENAEEVINLLIQALKFVSSGKIRPFIDANNKTYLSKLVLKLSRGHSQTAKVLKNLRSNPPQALSLVAQIGMEKVMWEYTHIMSLVEHSFFIAGIWTNDSTSQETIEQINQTIQDMTMSGGDFSLNPFESLSTTGEHSIRFDTDSFYEEDPNELTVDDFESLKKHGLVNEKRSTNEVPLIADEIDISPWKNLLMKFSQVHVCLEHLYRAESCLRADFASLKPIATKLLEIYVSDKSPIKTVGQLMNEPVQRVSIPLTNNIVKDHLKKPVSWYRITLKKKDNAANVGLKRDTREVYLYTQQPVFPPSVWQHLEPQIDDLPETTTIGEPELKYHCTKYTYISNKLPNRLP